MESSQEVDRRRRTLKELEEKTYHFPDSNVVDNDPKFCKYHRIVSHPVEECFVLKELIRNLASQGRIELDVDIVAYTNVATIVFGSFDPMSVPALSPRLEFRSTRGIY
ncbi:unnamed protein product [Prunus armeniaca]